MPNYCEYQMKVIGSDDAIKELISMMTYEHPVYHFYRVFSADVYETGNGYVCICGDVAWSINSAMRSYEGTCHRAGKQFAKIEKVSKHLKLEIEIFSSEPGIGFQEHFLFRDGETLIQDCDDYMCYWFDEAQYAGATREDRFAEFIEERGIKISIDELDENNEYHVGGIEGYGEWNI